MSISTLIIGTDFPTEAQNGQLFLNSNTGQRYVYLECEWREVLLDDSVPVPAILGAEGQYITVDAQGSLIWQDLPTTSGGPTTVSVDWSDITNKPTFFDGDYNSLSNLPSLFDGDYNSLSNLPVLFDGQYNSLTGLPSLFDGDYNSLSNLPSLFDGNYNSLSNLPVLFDGQYSSLSGLPSLFDGNYNSLSNVPSFATVATTGNYNDLLNLPTIPSGGGTTGNAITLVTTLPSESNADDEVIYGVRTGNEPAQTLHYLADNQGSSITITFNNISSGDTTSGNTDAVGYSIIDDPITTRNVFRRGGTISPAIPTDFTYLVRYLNSGEGRYYFAFAAGGTTSGETNRRINNVILDESIKIAFNGVEVTLIYDNSTAEYLSLPQTIGVFNEQDVVRVEIFRRTTDSTPLAIIDSLLFHQIATISDVQNEDNLARDYAFDLVQDLESDVQTGAIYSNVADGQYLRRSGNAIEGSTLDNEAILDTIAPSRIVGRFLAVSDNDANILVPKEIPAGGGNVESVAPTWRVLHSMNISMPQTAIFYDTGYTIPSTEWDTEDNGPVVAFVIYNEGVGERVLINTRELFLLDEGTIGGPITNTNTAGFALSTAGSSIDRHLALGRSAFNTLLMAKIVGEPSDPMPFKIETLNVVGEVTDSYSKGFTVLGEITGTVLNYTSTTINLDALPSSNSDMTFRIVTGNGNIQEVQFRANSFLELANDATNSIFFIVHRNDDTPMTTFAHATISIMKEANHVVFRGSHSQNYGVATYQIIERT